VTVTITLTTAGTDTGPFNLYSDVDGFVSAFETGVSKAALLAGYTSVLVPNGTTTIRVMSDNPLCTNFIDIVISGPCPTTTTTTSTTTTTTTCYASVSVDNNSTGDFGIISVTVNGVPVTYAGGDNFIIAAGQNGMFTTSNIGTVTVVVCYTAHTGNKSINLSGCGPQSFCCPPIPGGLDPLGGCCTFNDVNISCGCVLVIDARDGDCL